MSLFHENIKQILSEVEKFMIDTLKKEKLSKKSQEHKQVILDKINSFFEENPSMKIGTNPDNVSLKDHQDESSMTGGSSKSDESEEIIYNEAGIAIVGAADLKSPLVFGYMDKKQKKGSSLLRGPKFQTRWCVIQDGIFYYFVKPEDKKQAGSFRLEGYKFKNAPDIASKKKDKELCFELYQDDENKRIYQFLAKSKEDYSKWQEFIESGGQPLIEEDIYEEVGAEQPQSPKPTEDKKEEAIRSDAAEEEYEEPDAKLPPPPPPSANKLPPPPPPLVKRSPLPTPKEAVHEPEPIQDDIYEDAISAPAEKSEPPAVPGRVPAPPEVPPGIPKRPRNRELPAIPPPVVTPPKKKIKITLTCRPEEDFENKYYGKWDCTGDNSNELSFKKGEMIHVISKDFDDKSWWIGELNGKFGLIPKDYLTPSYVVFC